MKSGFRGECKDFSSFRQLAHSSSQTSSPYLQRSLESEEAEGPRGRFKKVKRGHLAFLSRRLVALGSIVLVWAFLEGCPEHTFQRVTRVCFRLVCY